MKLSAILISGFVMINPRQSPAKVGCYGQLPNILDCPLLYNPRTKAKYTKLDTQLGATGGKQPTPISERYDASVPLLGGGRLFYLHWELQRTQRKGGNYLTLHP